MKPLIPKPLFLFHSTTFLVFNQFFFPVKDNIAGYTNCPTPFEKTPYVPSPETPESGRKGEISGSRKKPEGEKKERAVCILFFLFHCHSFGN